jgi:putative hydrolase of the HAD superfamily
MLRSPIKGAGPAGRLAISAVFFDAAGTLFDVKGSVGQVYASFAARYGVSVAPRDVDEVFARAFRARSGAVLPRAAGVELLQAEKAWWFDVVRDVFEARMAASVLDRYFEEVFDAFRHRDVWQLYPDTVDALRLLHGAGRRLGIVSNFDSRLYDVLAELGIRSFFEQVVISWQAGAAKPDPRIFRAALDKMGLAPENAVHVGDSLRDDVMGAQAVELHAILLDRKNAHADWEGSLRVQTLSDAAAIILAS